MFLKKLKKFQEKIKKISVKMWENNINKIQDKFWIKIFMEFRLNYSEFKIFIKFKFVEYLRKIIPKSLDYFLVKFALISSIEVK